MDVPPHVERDEIGVAGAATEVDCAYDAGCRARCERADRPVSSFARRSKAAIRLLDVRLCAKAEIADPGLELIEITAHDRAKRGVQNRRAGALVFAKLGQHFMRCADELAGQCVAKPGNHILFVSRILVAVDEDDGDRSDVRFLE